MTIVRLICLIGILSLGAYAEQPEPPLLPSVMYTSDASTVKAVQLALRKRDYYTGAADGFLGQGTGDAIQRFQMDHGLQVKPVISRSLLIALGIANRPLLYR
jgi:peptidoglycan hydrolase-like protein with peptidoglycan-binding domain